MSLFRWKRGEHDELYRKINKFNRKIKQAQKKGYDYDLPETINYKQELDRILGKKDYTREEFNSRMKYINNFLQDNALDIKKGERGAKIPLWEFKKVKEEVKEINRKRMIQKRKLEEEDATDRGKKLGVKVKEIPDLATNKIREKKFNWKHMSKKDFEMFKETLWEFNQSIEEMDKQMYDNYFKAIDNEMGEKSLEGKILKELVSQLPPDVVIKKIYTDLNLGFKFVYSKSDYDIRFKSLKKGWTSIIKAYQKTLRSD